MDKFQPKLSLNELQNLSYSNMRKETLKEELSKLGELKNKELTIDPIFVYKDDEFIEIGTFVVNGTEKIFEDSRIPIVITNKNGNIIGNKFFLINDIIGLEPQGARPFNFKFEKNILKNINFTKDDIYIKIDTEMDAFDELYLDVENLPQEYSKEKLIEIKDILKVHCDTLKLSPLQICTSEKEGVELTLLVNNGTKEIKNIDLLPITIENEEGTILVSGLFEFNITNLSPMKSRIITIIFTKDQILNEFNEEDGYKVIFTVKN